MSEVINESTLDTIFSEKPGIYSGDSDEYDEYVMLDWDTEVIDLRQYLAEQDAMEEKFEEIPDETADEEEPGPSVDVCWDRNNDCDQMMYSFVFVLVLFASLAVFGIIYKDFA